MGMPVVMLSIAALCAAPAGATRPFVEDVRLGLDTLDYIDPEFYSEGNLMAFQDDRERLWVGELDPLTGLLRTASGQDFLLDSAIAEIPDSRNGPEWGMDDSGVDVYYTKSDSTALDQIWRAGFLPVRRAPVQLTHTRPASFGNFASYNRGVPTTGVAYAQIDSLYRWHVFIADEDSADTGWELSAYDIWQTGPRLVPGTRDWVYIATTADPQVTHLARFDWNTKQSRLLTDDPGYKRDVWAFPAPEYEGEISYVAQVDTHHLGIWRNLGSPDSMLTKVDSILLPVGSPHRYIYSLEPAFASTADSASYFAVLLNLRRDPRNPGDGAIWVLGLGWDPENRFALRVDSGAITGDTANRYEPEVYVGAEEVFVMYNNWRPGSNDLHRCRTGIALATTSLLEKGDSGSPGQSWAASIARGHITMDAVAGKVGRECHLLDAAGRKVANVRSGTIDLRALAPGVYFLVGAVPAEARVHSQAALKFVVTR
jgi:hypothetical protein